MIRPYTHSDLEQLKDMLLAEGLAYDDMGFTTGNTYVYDDGVVKGFYTYNMKHDIFPHLQHFCVDKENRDAPMTVGLALGRDFKKRMSDMGYNKSIIAIPNNKGSLNKIMRWFFKPKEYSQDNEFKFYLAKMVGV